VGTSNKSKGKIDSPDTLSASPKSSSLGRRSGNPAAPASASSNEASDTASLRAELAA
jgi:hypothetical protein